MVVLGHRVQLCASIPFGRKIEGIVYSRAWSWLPLDRTLRKDLYVFNKKCIFDSIYLEHGCCWIDEVMNLVCPLIVLCNPLVVPLVLYVAFILFPVTRSFFLPFTSIFALLSLPYCAPHSLLWLQLWKAGAKKKCILFPPRPFMRRTSCTLNKRYAAMCCT